jgi:spore germination protein YaaH
VAILGACSPVPLESGDPAASGGEFTDPVATLRPTAPPIPGHELYGYLPYWEMDDAGIAEHVADTPLTTLALFSVTHGGGGAVRETASGHDLVTGDVGRQLIDEAHERGTRVELVYTSFGGSRNRRLLEDPALQASVIASLVALAGDLGVDGINIDIEALDPMLVPAYGTFVAATRAAVLAADPRDQVSVATGGHGLGAAMAVAATEAGADRIFLMGYDYRTGRSAPGASAPLDRSDGGTASLRTSLDLYQALGVPADRLLLGLPLYGVDWPVVGPVIGAPSTGNGEAWFPRAHVDLLQDEEAVPERDEIEQVEVYFLGSDGSVGAPSIEPGASPETRTWHAVYIDSPETLAPKLTLANERGLAGAGFWAIGYERGLPGYRRLMEGFTGGDPLP